jgi:hypothetical protein
MSHSGTPSTPDLPFPIIAASSAPQIAPCSDLMLRLYLKLTITSI